MPAPELTVSNLMDNGGKTFDIDNWPFVNTRKRDDELIGCAIAYYRGPTDNDEFDVLEWWKGNSKE